MMEELEDLKLHENPEYMLDLTTAKVVHQIRMIMGKNGVTVTELARRLGKSKQYVSRLLNEKTNLTIKSLIKVSIALNCELSVKIEENEN